MMKARLGFALVAAATLAACGSKDETKQDGASFGQVLPGSASDAMLPYDTATSAPPLEPPTYEAETGSARKAGSGTPATPTEDIAPEAVPT